MIFIWHYTDTAHNFTLPQCLCWLYRIQIQKRNENQLYLCCTEWSNFFLPSGQEQISRCTQRPRKRKQSQKNILMKQTNKQRNCRCRPITLKSRCCVNAHCSVLQTTWHLTKEYENYCRINNWSFTKLTIAWNQNCLKANNVFIINSVVWRNTANVFKWISYQLYGCLLGWNAV
jgi:hypothetical protein